MNKRCIVHIPNKLDGKRSSGSQIRPIKMKNAFESIGYEVDFVQGYGNERKKKINEIKANIKAGVKYDFMYSENSTMPTLLTEKNHLPIHPLLDFSFFSFCKKNDIPIGLFYRDIYWKFPAYRDSVKGFKKLFAISAYKYDLIRYRGLLNYLFVPSTLVGKYFEDDKLENIVTPLPPGADNNSIEQSYKDHYYKERCDNYDGILRLFYVGGIGSHYKFKELLHGLSELNNIEITICCRENEWEENKENYSQYLTERVHVVHESGEGLRKYYRNADICLAYFQQDEYRRMAMPIKLFEYLSYTIPIITSCGTAASEFVSNNNIGWCIEYSNESICELLGKLVVNYDEVVRMHENSKEVLPENTWESRAQAVSKVLSSDNRDNGRDKK